MLMPGEYKEKNGKFYKEETKTIMVNDAIDLFPEDPDFNIKAPEIDWVMDKPTDYDRIKDAKKVLRKAFSADEQFKWGYILNVAMHLHAELCGDDVELKVERRNEIAEKLLKVIFYMGEE
jgi:hypothetical protein